MSPSMLQLQALGIQDVFLTKDPQINIFKYNYYRYVNFATEILKLPMTEVASWGRRSSCVVPKKGHLLSKLYLHIKLPRLTPNGGTYASWADSLGYSIFSEPIELEIGGVVVDKLYPQFLDMWDDLSNSDKQGRNLMLLKSDHYSASYYNATQGTDLMIPLEFWFTKKYNSALPLLSMHNQEIRLNFKFKEFSKCVNYDGSQPQLVHIQDSNVVAEYIYLDDVIIPQFQQQKHVFVIEQVQSNGDEAIAANTLLHSSSLKFNHPCKELLFAVSTKENIVNNNVFNYSGSDSLPLLQEASLMLDGKRRYDILPEIYYRTMLPDAAHSCIPLKYIYCMPFCIRPEENQPTGSLNLSRFNDVVLALKLIESNPDCVLNVFAVSYNIVTIEKGTLTLEFAV
jgi:Major capsid protein N-terminus/Large eukaryotic DNA virus major capsid protein